jgi:hypothetical protein
MAWQSERIRDFRVKLKKEGIFPGCLGCCQSEYIGSMAREVVTEDRVQRVKFSKTQESDCVIPAFRREIPGEHTGCES